jgi:hypothetical protein
VVLFAGVLVMALIAPSPFIRTSILMLCSIDAAKHPFELKYHEESNISRNVHVHENT